MIYNQNKLYTPTFITKIKKNYFIVDCWHHRILYSAIMNTWKVLDQEISGPHSIVSNGEIYVAEDTGKNAIRIYGETHDKCLCLKQIITSIGIRPHRSIYSSKTDTFYIISSQDQTIFSLGYNKEEVFIKSYQLIPELQG